MKLVEKLRCKLSKRYRRFQEVNLYRRWHKDWLLSKKEVEGFKEKYKGLHGWDAIQAQVMTMNLESLLRTLWKRKPNKPETNYGKKQKAKIQEASSPSTGSPQVNV